MGFSNDRPPVLPTAGIWLSGTPSDYGAPRASLIGPAGPAGFPLAYRSIIGLIVAFCAPKVLFGLSPYPFLCRCQLSCSLYSALLALLSYSGSRLSQFYQARCRYFADPPYISRAITESDPEYADSPMRLRKMIYNLIRNTLKLAINAYTRCLLRSAAWGFPDRSRNRR